MKLKIIITVGAIPFSGFLCALTPDGETPVTAGGDSNKILNIGEDMTVGVKINTMNIAIYNVGNKHSAMVPL